MKITREIKTAILVIASILLFIWGYSFLKGQNLFNSHKKLYVEYDNVEGLATSAAVTVNGKIVGKVNLISLNSNGKLLIEIQINDDDFPISKTSIAQIYEPGFIGGKQIAIIPDYKNKNLAISGDKLASDVKMGLMSSVGEKLVPTQQKIDKLVVDADGLVNNFNGVLDAQTKQNLKNSIEQLNQTLTEINKATQKVNTLLASNQQKINNSLANVERASGNFAKISDDLEKAKLSQTVKSLEATLDNVNKIMANLESGKGSMGKLLKDDAMYNNLTKTSKELELLLQDVRLHPTRYVNVSLFGKKEKPYIEPTQK
ncbi:MlaD family protein [Flavobacterium sp.]|uniref:MlaD family protein n=1 Tax=Flavobacterium sp. TaxID=239 RepID=UPI00286C7351|nr:MlaD family protein [Flavobacterium sp.]